MNNKTEALSRLDTTRLMDVVKNYKQYGYDESLRNSALVILEGRGIKREELVLSGNFYNAAYDNVERMYRSYTHNSNLAFLMYILTLLFNLGGSSLIAGGGPAWLPAVVMVTVILLYLRFLIGSFIDQSNFFKSIGKKWNGSDQMVYFVVGMPLYIFMHYYYRNQMRDAMNLVH